MWTRGPSNKTTHHAQLTESHDDLSINQILSCKRIDKNSVSPTRKLDKEEYKARELPYEQY